MDTVTVIMSTYNGEEYLEEQIESILSQIDVSVNLFIRDDGSNDNTRKILENYRKYNNIKILLGKNIGVGPSFITALKRCPTAAYYAFADQDDIWLSDKLKKAVIKLKCEIEEPALYVSNQVLVDKRLKKIGIRFEEKPNISLVGTIMGCRASGCTMVFNHRLYKVLCEDIHQPKLDFFNLRIHDAWVLAVANCVGKVIYDENSYILYRQHENNVVGATKKSFIQKASGYYDMLLNFRKKGRYKSKMALQLLESLDENSLSDEIYDVLWNFANYRKMKVKLNLLRNQEITEDVDNKLRFYIQVILGIL